jgi:hypothetical protein
MTCDYVCHLIDEYLDNRLSRRERQRLETHISACPRCAEVLREHLAFERNLRQALVTSVQPLQLAPAASKRVVWAVEGNVRQPWWRGQTVRTAQMAAAALVLSLVLLGLAFLLGRTPVPSEPEQLGRRAVAGPGLAVDRAGIFVEPWDMRPGDSFTVTLPIESNLPQPVDDVRCDLDISGPTGRYHFVLVLQDSLPSQGMSVLQVTSDLLASPSQKQYQITPADMFGLPGVYTLRVTVFSPVAISSQ